MLHTVLVATLPETSNFVLLLTLITIKHFFSVYQLHSRGTLFPNTSWRNKKMKENMNNIKRIAEGRAENET